MDLEIAGHRLAGYGIDAATVLESTLDGVMILDGAWRLIYLNRRAKAMIAGDRHLIGENFWEAFPRPPGGVFENACRKVMTERVATRCEDVYPPLRIWFENSIHPCGAGIAVHFRDVTSEKRREQALRDSEEQARQQLAELEMIYATAPVGLAVLSADCQFLRLNERFAAMNGLPVAAHIGRSVREVLPQVADFAEAIARRIVETGEPALDLQVEGETARRPGVKGSWVEHWLPLKDTAGRVVSINVVVEEVSGLKRIERELRERNAELHAVLDAVPAAVWIAHDTACRVITGNRLGMALLRLAPDANPSSSAPAAERPRNFTIMKDGIELPADQLPMQIAASTGREIRGFEEEIVFDDGTVRHIYGNAAPLRDASGNLRGAVGAFVDVTEMARARQVLARSRDELERIVAERTREIVASNDRLHREKAFTELLLASTSEGIFAFDRDLRYTLWNPAMERVWGMSAQEVLGRVATEVFPFIAGTETERVMRGAVGGLPGSVHEQPYDVPETGRNGYFDCYYAPLRDGNGHTTGAVAVLRDTTERRAMEMQLRQAQKMEAVGQLTGGIAHDFNNLLTAFAGNVELIAARAVHDEQIGRLARTALRAVERGSRLTGQLLAFSREQKLSPEIVDLRELVLIIENVLKRALGESIYLVIAADMPLWPCRVDPAHFETALLNLVLNARDAMPEGGTLKMDIRNVHLDERIALGRGPHVMVAVTDTGCGMSPETVRRAFEPFYTTKDLGKGTGLGLSMVHDFVRQSGGRIDIESTPGSGTKIALYLPRAETTQATALPVEDRPEQIPAGSETILVAEDDVDVSEVVAAMLHSLGYTVLCARTGNEAIELLRRRGDIGLLLTDVVMPGGMSGIELARGARRLRPDMAVLLVSGYAERVLSAQRVHDEFPIVSKPLHRGSLARAIRRLLDAATTPPE